MQHLQPILPKLDPTPGLEALVGHAGSSRSACNIVGSREVSVGRDGLCIPICQSITEARSMSDAHDYCTGNCEMGSHHSEEFVCRFAVDVQRVSRLSSYSATLPRSSPAKSGICKSRRLNRSLVE